MRRIQIIKLVILVYELVSESVSLEMVAYREEAFLFCIIEIMIKDYVQI